MASQDLIPQFSQESIGVPAAQPDRSRTPRRPHQDWHQPVPTFRGPMHYAMTTPRPFWHPAGVPPPPPVTSSFSSRPTWIPTAPHSSFPPIHLQLFHKHLRITQFLHLNATTLRRDRRCLWHHLLALLRFERATLAVQLIFHQWTSGNRTSIFTTPTR